MIEFAVKEEFAVFGIEANDAMRQHIDGEVWRELENIIVGK